MMCWLITFTGKPESICSGHLFFSLVCTEAQRLWVCHCTLQRQLSLICPAVTVQDLGMVKSCILVAVSSSATAFAPQPCYFCQAAHFAFAARAFVPFPCSMSCSPSCYLSTKNYSCYFWWLSMLLSDNLLEKAIYFCTFRELSLFYSTLQLAFEKDICMQEKEDLKQKCNIDGYLVCLFSDW